MRFSANLFEFFSLVSSPDTIRVGCLPGQSQLDDQFEDDLMTLTGWGITCDNGCGQPNNMNFAKDR